MTTTMQTIIVPLDGSDLSRHILPSVRLLASLTSARILLIRAIADAPSDEMRQQVEPTLQREAQILRDAGFTVDIEIAFQSPPVAIVERAKETHAALIAMATHGYSGLRRWALGSVTDEVVHTTTTPVFVVRCQDETPDETPHIKQILVPLDGSDLAEKALPIATMLATQAHASVLLMRSVVPIDVFYDGLQPVQIPPSVVQESTEEAQQQAQGYLNRIAERLRTDGVIVETHVAIGRAEDAIVEDAMQQHIDLVIMATHGYGEIERWLIGSVADKVLHATRTPLLLVHAKDEKEGKEE